MFKTKQYGYRVKCCVSSCGAKRQENLGRTFFKFPAREKELLLKKWRDACNLEEEIVTKNLYICEMHFEKDLVLIQKLKKGSVPTLNLDYVSNGDDNSNHKTYISKKK